VEDGKGGATVELLVSDNAAADTAVESLHIRTRVNLVQDAYLPAVQVAAMKRAVEILQQVEKTISKTWNKP